MLSRRSLLGFIAAAPVIIKASSLMPVWSFVAPPAFVYVEYGVGFSTDAMYDGWFAAQQRLLHAQFARNKLLAAARAMNGEPS